MPLFRQEKSLTELDEETERLESEDKRSEVELSIAQKRAATARLKEHGLTPRHFRDGSGGFSWKKVIRWLKTH